MTAKKEEEIKLITWLVPETEKHHRSKKWYIWAGSIAIFFLIYAIFTLNFLFAIIIISFATIITISDNRNIEKIEILLDEEGIHTGRTFYDYDLIKDFSILYKPKDNLGNLYFEFNNTLKQRLSIPLEDQDPIIIRDFLLKYLEEDLDRTNPPLSESLSRLLKI